MIGTLGEVAFEVSTSKILTYKKMMRSSSARVHKHEIIAKKPVLEYVGDDLDEIPLSVRLDATKNINVLDEIERLRAYKSNGESLSLIIGGYVMGDFIIESLSDDWQMVGKNGLPTLAIVNMQLTEAIEWSRPT